MIKVILNNLFKLTFAHEQFTLERILSGKGASNISNTNVFFSFYVMNSRNKKQNKVTAITLLFLRQNPGVLKPVS